MTPEMVAREERSQLVAFRRGEKFRELMPMAESSCPDPAQVAREIRVEIFPAMQRAKARWRLRTRAKKWAPRAYALLLVGFLLACQAALHGHLTLGIAIASFFAGAIALCGVLIAEDDQQETGRVIGRGER